MPRMLVHFVLRCVGPIKIALCVIGSSSFSSAPLTYETAAIWAVRVGRYAVW